MNKVERQHPVEQDPILRRTNFDAVENNFTDEFILSIWVYLVQMDKIQFQS